MSGHILTEENVSALARRPPGERARCVPGRREASQNFLIAALAAALVHRPRVIFLDEPTIGLDVAVKARLRGFIQLMRERYGLTVLLTSHDLGDIEELCPRMIMIDRGRIVYDGLYAEMSRRFGWEKSVVITPTHDDRSTHAAIAAALAAWPARLAEPDQGRVRITFDTRRVTVGQVIGAITTAVEITDLAIEEVGAETIVRRLYDGELDFGADPP